MNVVYISQVYLNFTPGSQAHQVFVSGKTRDQSKKPALNQQTIRLENRGLSKKYNQFIACSAPTVHLRVTAQS